MHGHALETVVSVSDTCPTCVVHGPSCVVLKRTHNQAWTRTKHDSGPVQACPFKKKDHRFKTRGPLTQAPSFSSVFPIASLSLSYLVVLLSLCQKKEGKRKGWWRRRATTKASCDDNEKDKYLSRREATVKISISFSRSWKQDEEDAHLVDLSSLFSL